MTDDPGYPANSCMFCHRTDSRWYLLRHGDAVASWSCDDHLVYVLDALQRENEVSEITVKRSVHSAEAQP